jgi:hypothetical protein
MQVRGLSPTVPTDDRDLPGGGRPPSGHSSGTMLRLSGRDGGGSPVRQNAAGSLRKRYERVTEHIRISAGVADRNQGSRRVEATPWLRLLLWVVACAALVISLALRKEAPARSLEMDRPVFSLIIHGGGSGASSAPQEGSARAALEPCCRPLDNRPQGGRGVRLAQNSEQSRRFRLGSGEVSGDGDRWYIETLLDFLCGRQAVASVCQADVRQHEIWALASNQGDQLLTGFCSADDRVTQSGDFAAEILGYQPVILGDCDAQRLHQVLPTCIGPTCVVTQGEITHP